MKKWLKRTYCKIFNIQCCCKCEGMDTKYGYYARGTNNLDNQPEAYGDYGLLCLHCWYIEWDVPHEEHIKNLPVWCVPYSKSSK